MAIYNRISSFILLALGVGQALGSESASGSRLVVNTTSGRFAPYFPPSHPGVASFPDIAYAQNPTGPLRFAPPVPATPPSDDKVVHATELPAGCFQYVSPAFRDAYAVKNLTAMNFQRGYFDNTTEDCLHLSIFAPRAAVEHAAAAAGSDSSPGSGQRRSVRGMYAREQARDLLPVVIWIHGGGVSWGGINVPYQLAPDWVQRSQAHVVVEVQYRLSLLGLPNAAGLRSENRNLNLALLDQRLAVEWVRDNIAELGGDPDRITLWGESAGGSSVDTYLYAWASDPIVKGAIAASGNAPELEPISVSPGENGMFSTAARTLGCGGLGPAEELACMRDLPASAFQAYLQAEIGAGGAADDLVSFSTVVDNVTVFASYEARMAAGGDQMFAAGVPMLMGSNRNEGGIFLPSDFAGGEIPPALQAQMLTFQLTHQCNTVREVRLRTAAGATTYQYEYAGNFTNVSPEPWLGAYHGSELPMVFGTYGIEGPSTEFEARVSAGMQDLFLAFAKDPASGLQRAGWAPAARDSGSWQIMRWADDGVLGQLVSVDDLRAECVQNQWPV